MLSVKHESKRRYNHNQKLEIEKCQKLPRDSRPTVRECIGGDSSSTKSPNAFCNASTSLSEVEFLGAALLQVTPSLLIANSLWRFNPDLNPPTCWASRVIESIALSYATELCWILEFHHSDLASESDFLSEVNVDSWSLTARRRLECFGWRSSSSKNVRVSISIRTANELREFVMSDLFEVIKTSVHWSCVIVQLWLTGGHLRHFLAVYNGGLAGSKRRTQSIAYPNCHTDEVRDDRAYESRSMTIRSIVSDFISMMTELTNKDYEYYLKQNI